MGTMIISIGIMFWKDRKMLIVIRKMLLFFYSSTQSVSGKMKINGNNENFHRKNDFEEWKNYVQLYTYTLTGKMKFNENNENFDRKNGLDK